jgi:general secretion pathway protein L
MAATGISGERAMPQWRVQLASFWRWWRGELSDVAQERLGLLRGAADVPQVAVDAEHVVLVEPRTAPEANTRIEAGPMDTVRAGAALRSALRRAGETRARARLCLEHGDALVRRVAMPAATEENLRQVLGFEMDRLTPFRAEDVYFDYRVVSRDAASGQLSVQVALARRELVDRRVQRLRELGANVQGVAVRDAAGHTVQAIDLLPSEQRGEGETARERFLQRAIGGAVLVLFALALLIPLWQKRETIIALQPVLARAQQEAASTNAVADRLQRRVEDYNFMVGRKLATYPALAYVEEVSRLLPDTTWLQQMQIRSTGKTRDVEITGETTSSSKLIEILSQSALLRNPVPRGTMTRGSTPNSERFMIQAEAPPRALPEPRPLLAEAGSKAPSSRPVPAAPRPPPQQETKPAATATLKPAPAAGKAAPAKSHAGASR